MTKRQEEPAAFCAVANIAEETAHGEGGLELRRGMKHFPPGAKVWVLPPQWGDGADQLIIARHHRGTRGHGFARMVPARRPLTGFRVRGVYSPALIRALTRPLSELNDDHAPRLWQTWHEAEQATTLWRTLPLTTPLPTGPSRLWSPTRRLPKSPGRTRGTTWRTSTRIG